MSLSLVQRIWFSYTSKTKNWTMCNLVICLGLTCTSPQLRCAKAFVSFACFCVSSIFEDLKKQFTSATALQMNGVFCGI